MKRAILLRLQALPDRTLGVLYVFDGIFRRGQYCTLELPWHHNEHNKSCIPEGSYTLSPCPPTDKIPYPCLLVGGTQPRQGIKVHKGNFPQNTEGCILVGLAFGTADTDAIPDVVSSRPALDDLMNVVTSTIPLEVLDLTGRTA